MVSINQCCFDLFVVFHEKAKILAALNLLFAAAEFIRKYCMKIYREINSVGVSSETCPALVQVKFDPEAVTI